MVLRIARPHCEELRSKGEMRGTHSKGFWGAGGAGKGRSTVVKVHLGSRVGFRGLMTNN
jgi:hypothetical protein